MHVHFVGEPDDGITVSSHHARALAAAGVEVTFAPPEGPTVAALRRADVVHLVTEAQRDGTLLRRLAAARLLGTPVLRCWTGRDVLWAKHHPPSRGFAHALTRMGVTQVARTPALVGQLTRIGIPSRVGPLFSLHICDARQPEPLPATFTVLCSLPSSRRRFSGGAWIDSLIRRLRSTRFLILGDAATDYSAYRNVESLGVVDDVNRAIQRSTALLEARTDGTLSRLSLEALSHGRHVLATCFAPHCQHVGSEDACAAQLRDLDRTVDFNLPGREFVCREHGRREGASRLIELLHEVCEGNGWVGISRGVSGAMIALCNPGACGRRSHDWPDGTKLPPEAGAFRALLSDVPRDATRATTFSSAGTP